MPFENIKVKVTKRGEIIVQIEGSEEQRVRDFKTFLEEVLGPITSEELLKGPTWEREGELALKKKEEIDRRQG